MDLADFSKQNGGFYAPTFLVKVDGQAMTQSLGLAISQAEVEVGLASAGRFSFTVTNSFSLKSRAFETTSGRPAFELLRFGAGVDVHMGYGDFSRLPLMIRGTITEVTTSFSEGGSPELTVAGYDGLFPMTLGKRSRSWPQKADSDIASMLATDYGLTAAVDSTDQLPQIEQNQESDFDLLKKLADRNHFEFYVSPPAGGSGSGTLRFGRPKDAGEGVVTLLWGRTLLNFKPEVNLAAQVTQVEVYGWNSDNKQPIVGKAAAGEETGRDPGRRSGGQRLQQALGRSVVLQVRQPVFTEAEATRRAKAILNDHAKKFLTGDAESIGVPDLRPDRNITLGNLGEPFSKTYYIQQTVHKVDSSGYRTRIKLKETSL